MDDLIALLALIVVISMVAAVLIAHQESAYHGVPFLKAFVTGTWFTIKACVLTIIAATLFYSLVYGLFHILDP